MNDELIELLLPAYMPHYHGSGVHREGHQRWHEEHPYRALHRESETAVWSGITWGVWEPTSEVRDEPGHDLGGRTGDA